MSARQRSARLRVGAVAVVATLVPGAVTALQFDWTFKGAAVGQFDGGRDFGLNHNPPTRSGYLDLTPWVHLQFSDTWSGLVRARLFAPTDAALVAGNDNNNVGASSKVYIGLKEAWLDYRGLTSYPGESFRLGRQRLRQDDAQWWDQDVDTARWIFETSLLQFQVGGARQFSSYRSDDAPLPPTQKNRTYTFGTFAWEGQPGLRLGLRGVHADDDSRDPLVGGAPPGDGKFVSGHPTWIGGFVDNHAFDIDIAPNFSYWGSATGELGSRHRLNIATDATGARTVTGETPETIRAWAADVGLRYRTPTPLPVHFGAAYAYSTGGQRGYKDDQFEQTGLQSNYSRWTGTRSLVHRYNEAFRAELGNLKVASVFVATDVGNWDASAVASNFRRMRGDGPVISDGITAAPVTGSKKLGNGYDLVLTRYLGTRKPTDRLEPGEDSQTSLRVRGSLFDPGKAYGPDAKTEYRVTLELTLWY